MVLEKTRDFFLLLFCCNVHNNSARYSNAMFESSKLEAEKEARAARPKLRHSFNFTINAKVLRREDYVVRHKQPERIFLSDLRHNIDKHETHLVIRTVLDRSETFLAN